MPKVRRGDKPVVLPLCYGCKHHDDECHCTSPNKLKMVAVLDAEQFPTSRYEKPPLPDTSRVGSCTGFEKV